VSKEKIVSEFNNKANNLLLVADNLCGHDDSVVINVMREGAKEITELEQENKKLRDYFIEFLNLMEASEVIKQEVIESYKAIAQNKE
jgi:hypothetical protein